MNAKIMSVCQWCPYELSAVPYRTAFDLHLSVGILRAKSGLDFSAHIASEEQVVTEVTMTPDGKRLDETFTKLVNPWLLSRGS